MHHSTTMFLAQLIGISFLVTAIAMLMQKRAAIAAIDGIMKDHSLLLILGLVILVPGVAIILTHNEWTGGVVPVIVTIVGWWLALKGALVLLVPSDALMKSYKAMNYSKNFYGFMIIVLAIGVFLTYAGFWG